MESLDLFKWVNKANNSSDKAFRQSIHTLIHAISNSTFLQENMIFHGGILMAIRFQGIRYTKDVDFATSQKCNNIDKRLGVELF